MKLYWTEHSKIKMRQYGLSKSKLMNVIYKPERKEKGIADGTTAVMQTRKLFSFAKAAGKEVASAKASAPRRKVPGEIWLMYKDDKDLRKIISAWRYPGISKPGDVIPVPQDILDEILNPKS